MQAFLAYGYGTPFSAHGLRFTQGALQGGSRICFLFQNKLYYGDPALPRLLRRVGVWVFAPVRSSPSGASPLGLSPFGVGVAVTGSSDPSSNNNKINHQYIQLPIHRLSSGRDVIYHS